MAAGRLRGFGRWRFLSGMWLCLPVLLFASVFAACEPEPPTPTATAEPVDPREVLQRTVGELTALQSVSFDLAHVVGSTNILPGVLMNRAYGTAVVPGAFEVTVESELLFPRSYLEIGMVTVDGASYMTNILSGDWEEVDVEALPINLTQLGVTLAGIVERVQSPELLGEERVDGADIYRIEGNIVSEALKELVPTAGTGFPVTLEIWVEQGSGMLRQARITGQVVVTDVEDAERMLTLDKANEPVNIEAPEL